LKFMETDHWDEIELRHLSALEAVAKAGSFRQAAARLGRAQSVVSEQIAGLERVVGKRLVQRSRGPGGVRLTDAGELLLGHAAAIRARLQAARADFGALDEGSLGTLRVGITQSVGVRVLPALMRIFTRDWPDVEIAPSEAHSDLDLYARLESGELDLSFVELPAPDGPFETVRLLDDPYVLLLLRDAPLAGRARRPSLVEIGALPLIGNLSCRGLARVSEQLRARGTEPRFVFRSDVNATVQALVAAGIGAAILPRLAVDPADPVVVSYELPGIPPRTLALAWHRDRVRPPTAEAFVAAAVEVCDGLGRGPAEVSELAR
jgi:molybdate transport repressor ModE-like protein